MVLIEARDPHTHVGGPGNEAARVGRILLGLHGLEGLLSHNHVEVGGDFLVGNIKRDLAIVGLLGGRGAKGGQSLNTLDMMVLG